MTGHLIRGPSGHLRKSASGHLVNQCAPPIVYEFSLLGAAIDGGGWIWPSPNQVPTLQDYQVAWADLPDGSDPGGDAVACGYTWPWVVGGELTWGHVLSAYGTCGDVDTSDLAGPPTSARLKIVVANHAGNNWPGTIGLEVRYSKVGWPANPGKLVSYAGWGTLAGTITLDSGDPQKTVYFTVPPEDIDPDGWFYLAIIPDCSTDPGYPGGDDWYERKLTLQAWLEVRGTREG